MGALVDGIVARLAFVFDMPNAHVSRHRLQLTVEVFSADKAVLRVIREEQLDDVSACADCVSGLSANVHALLADRRAGGDKATVCELDHAGAAGGRRIVVVDLV